MPVATPVFGAIKVDQVRTINGITWLIVPCIDYDAYKDLPDVVSYNNDHFALMSFDSDKGQAVYRNDGKIAYSMLRKVA